MRLFALRWTWTLLAISLAACGGEGGFETDDRATALFRSPEQHLVRAGMGGDTAGVIGIILGARIVGAGDAVAVLDGVPPHVKVYGRDGRLRAAFLGRGGGPRETPYPSALAPAGDSAVLVSDVSGRVALFSLDGTLLSETRVLGVAVLAAADACGDGWILYGPRTGAAGAVGWLHRVRLAAADSFSVERVYADSIRSGLLPVGVTYGLALDGDTLVVRHGFGSHSRLVRWGCGSETPRVSEVEGVGTIPARGPDERGRGFSAFVHRNDDPIAAGMAVTRSGVWMADVFYGREREGVTRLSRPEVGGRETVNVAGVYQLRDSRRGVGVLVSTHHPVPHVFLLSEEAFAAVLPPR
jgi:hypothetical protein